VNPRLIFAVILAQAAAFTIVACGARTALDDGVSNNAKGGGGAGGQSSEGGSPLVGGSSSFGGEGGGFLDAGMDADALPPIDATPPPNDASLSCPIGGLTAFLLGDNGSLFTFDPDTLATTNLGVLNCPSQSTPWTLTAASSGLLYAVYQDWRIYEIDPRTLTCTATPYDPTRLDVGTGIGVTVAPGDAGEVMYIYGIQSTTTPALARGDLQTFTMSLVGEIIPKPSSNHYPIDIRANAFGRMFGLSSDGLFIEIDKSNATILAQNQTTFREMGSFALLTWNDDFYFFNGANVSKYDVATNSLALVDTLPGAPTIVGASAAPCLH
jgi:hypothetical protein